MGRPIDNWIAARDRLLDLDANLFVPGHGPVTDRAGVARLRGYLDYVGEQAAGYRQQGNPHTAAEIDITGYADWGHPERLVSPSARSTAPWAPTPARPLS